MGAKTCVYCEVVVITDSNSCEKCGNLFKTSNDVAADDAPVTFTVESMHLDKMRKIMSEAEFQQYLLVHEQNKLLEEQIRIAKQPRRSFGMGMLFPLSGSQSNDDE